MINDINAEPDYGDEAPSACSSRVFLGHDSFACGGTPGHAGKHGYRLPWVTIEWDGRAERAAEATRQPAAAPGPRQTVPLAEHVEYIKAGQQLALSLHEATEPLLHGTIAEQKLGRELRERHGLEPS